MPINARSFLTKLPARARLLALAPVTTLLLTAPLATAGDPGRGGLGEREAGRRGERANEAHGLLLSGDEAYRTGNWKQAVEAYGKARDLLPNAPATAELRDAATERFALASIEYSRELSRQGDVAGAKAAVDRVLDASVAPQHAGALAQRAKLDDPIRTNPALTKEHAADMEEVKLLLYKAQGAYDLGKYDEAKVGYEGVLRIDPYNKAARRGMEVADKAKTDYAHSAYDHALAEILSQVEEAWELKPAPLNAIPGGVTGSQLDASMVLLSTKLKGIVIPSVDLDNVTLDEAVDYLRAQATRYDTFSTEPKDKGINFVVSLGNPDSEAAKAVMAQKITLQLKSVPLADALKYINDITHTEYSAQGYAVTIRPVGVATGEIMSQTFQAPPYFLSMGGDAAGGTDAANADPFASGGDKKEGLAARKVSAEDILKGHGVPFPEGSSVIYNRGNGQLIVRNTAENLLLVDQVISSMTEQAPASVVVEVKILRTKHVQQKELGWDWFLGEFSLGGNGIDNTLLTGGDNTGAITSGNRSGNTALSGNSLDTLLSNRSSGFAPPANRAPAALDFLGLMNNTSVEVLMRGLNQRKDTSLAVVPSTTVTSGQASTIEIGRELIYPTEYEPPELPNSVLPTDVVDNNGFITDQVSAGTIPVTPSHPTSFTKRLVGTILEVLPTASADHNYVDLAIKPTVTDFDGFVNFGSPIVSGDTVLNRNEILMPVFSTMRADTHLTIANGATIVFGGMLQEKVQKVQDHTPILGNLPLVGRLFHEEAYEPEKTAIIMMVTVRVVDPAGHTLGDN